MADFDLSLVVRAQDQGASAAGDKLTRSINTLATAEDKASASAGRLVGSTATVAGAQDKATTSTDRMTAAEFRAVGGAAGLEAANRKLVSSANQQAAAHGGLVRSLGQTRAGTVQLGQQIQDVGIQLSSGTDLIRVLAQQAGQTGFAMSQMGGTVGKVGVIMGGIGVSAALALVSVLGTMLFSSKKAETAQKDLGDGINFAALSAKELVKSIGELEDAERKSIRTTYQAEQAKLADARAALTLARANREIAKSSLERALAQQSGDFEQGAFGGGKIGPRVASLRADLAQLDAAIGSAASLERLANIPVIQREITAATDGAAAATLKYDAALAKLNTRFAGKDRFGKALAANLVIDEATY
nr:hypothetical protein [Sphingomonas sp.]